MENLPILLLPFKENNSFASYPCPRASFLSELITIDPERFGGVSYVREWAAD
jgi:hypothetical protein